MANHPATIRTRRIHRSEPSNSSFADALSRVWPAHAAKQISVLSGISQRNVENWLSGLSKPSADAICALLRSERGFEFLSELVAGTDAEWWRMVVVGIRLAELERRQAEARQALLEAKSDAVFQARGDVAPLVGVARFSLAR